MRITDIGEVREDGSILLYDENIKGRKDLPRRIRPSAVQKQVLANGIERYIPPNVDIQLTQASING